MAPLSFTKGKVALLESFLRQARGSDARKVSHAWGMLGVERREINLEDKKLDVGAVIEETVRQSQIEPERKVNKRKKKTVQSVPV